MAQNHECHIDPILLHRHQFKFSHIARHISKGFSLLSPFPILKFKKTNSHILYYYYI